MNRFYFLTLLFILFSVGTQAKAVEAIQWKINNKTNKTIHIRAEIRRTQRGKTEVKERDVTPGNSTTFLGDHIFTLNIDGKRRKIENETSEYSLVEKNTNEYEWKKISKTSNY